MNHETMQMLMKWFQESRKTSDSFNKLAGTYLDVHKDWLENWVDINPAAFMWMLDAVSDINEQV